MSVNSDENKDLLKQILKEHPLVNENKVQFEELLNYHIEIIHQNRFKYKSDLKEMNKELLLVFSKIANDMKSQKRKKVQQKKKIQKQKQPTNISFNQQPQNIKFKSQISNNFAMKLKEQQNTEYKPPELTKPKEIDFTDKLENVVLPPIDTTMKERENELSNIISQYANETKAKKWISEETNAKNLTIDHQTNVELEPEFIRNPTKKVTFKNDIVMNEILQEILSNQTKIIATINELAISLQNLSYQ